MNRRSLATHGLLALAVSSFLLLAGGCGTERGAAPGSPILSSDEGMWVKDLASGGVGPLAQGAKPSAGEGATMAQSATAALSSALIDGAVGGVVSNGRVTVLFPPGAFPGEQTISLDVQSADGYVECHLLPEGLQFQVPVELSMSLRNTTGDMKGTTIYWYDPDTDTWVDMLGAYDPSAHGVIAKLHHFSDYRAGRAGW